MRVEKLDKQIDEHRQLAVITTEERQRYSPIAVSIVKNAKVGDLQSIHDWATGLVEIRRGGGSLMSKAKAAMALTMSRKVVWPAIEMTAQATKRFGWDERSKVQRMGIGGIAAGLALFGGANAGIAALGTAIAVPLWVVTGSGAAFAGVLIEEVKRRQRDQ
jgi:hypothetical protein